MYPDLHQNLIGSSLSHTQPVHQTFSKSVYNFLRYPTDRQTDSQSWKHNLHPPSLTEVIMAENINIIVEDRLFQRLEVHSNEWLHYFDYSGEKHDWPAVERIFLWFGVAFVTFHDEGDHQRKTWEKWAKWHRWRDVEDHSATDVSGPAAVQLSWLILLPWLERTFNLKRLCFHESN